MDDRIGVEEKDDTKELFLFLDFGRINSRTINNSTMIFEWDDLKKLADTLQAIVNEKPDYEKFIIKLV